MIPSVQERKKNVHIFMNSYPQLCRIHSLIPNPNIKVDNSNNVLDFVGDRLKLEDWNPVLEAIRNDKSLHFISIRSRHSKVRVLQEPETENKSKQTNTPKLSQMRTSGVLLRITEALSKCLSNSAALSGLLLEKIPLDSNAMKHLTQGLEVCPNLQQLSLPHTQIGDDECQSLCHVLRGRLNLVWLNLTGCDLTDKGVAALCNLLKFQKLNRYGESWKQSLRCRPVNPNAMPGLRRLTLNQNCIGDPGVKIFVDTLIDDLWLKALDMQHCGITLIGAESLMNLVKENRFLSVVDVRGNSQVPNNLVAAIVQQLAENNRDATPEFQWLKEDVPKRSCVASNSSTCAHRPGSQTTVVSRGLSLLSSKGLASLGVLPNRPILPRPRSLSARTRSSEAKRSCTTNNTPRPPWNWNYSNMSLRRGNSAQLMPTKKPSQDVMFELHAVKEQLLEVSRRLEQETERRTKIEMELEKYKKMIEVPEIDGLIDKETLQTIFYQFCNSYLKKHNPELPKQEADTSDDELGLKKHDSLESVIRTINGDNQTGLELSLSETNSSNGHNSAQCAPSRAQLLFETLISS